jgi:hypothetical protein
MTTKREMFDVVAVSLDNRNVLWTMGPRDERNAEAIIMMAVERQGVEDRFFTTCKPGKYAQGDHYEE